MRYSTDCTSHDTHDEALPPRSPRWAPEHLGVADAVLVLSYHTPHLVLPLVYVYEHTGRGRYIASSACFVRELTLNSHAIR